MRCTMICWILYMLIITPLRVLRGLGWCRFRLEGRENLPPREVGGMILAMNHANWLDIPAVSAMIPLSHRLSWLGKSEIFEHPFGNWFFHTMQVVPIRRGRRDMAALDALEDALRAGAVLIIFPEGTRSKDGALQKGHSGTIRLAMRTGVPVVPMAMSGNKHGVRGLVRERKPMVFRIGTPYRVLPTESGRVPASMMQALTADLMYRIASMLPEEDRGVYADLPEHFAARAITTAV